MRATIASLPTVLTALAITACNGGPSPADFAGTYNVTSTYTSNFEGSTDTSTESGPMTVTEGSVSDIIINTPSCALPANIVGDTGIQVPATLCTAVLDGGSLQWTVSGSGNLADASLSLNLSGPATISSGGVSYTGTVSLQIAGTRL